MRMKLLKHETTRRLITFYNKEYGVVSARFEIIAFRAVNRLGVSFFQGFWGGEGRGEE